MTPERIAALIIGVLAICVGAMLWRSASALHRRDTQNPSTWGVSYPSWFRRLGALRLPIVFIALGCFLVLFVFVGQ